MYLGDRSIIAIVSVVTSLRQVANVQSLEMLRSGQLEILWGKQRKPSAIEVERCHDPVPDVALDAT